MAKNYFIYSGKGKQLSLVFFVVFLIISLTPSVFAAPKGSIEVRPAYVDVDLTQKASEVDIEISYTNHSEKAVTLELFPIDFRQTNAFGSIGFLGQDASEYSYSLSSFLSFETERIDLLPQEKKTVRILARNRQDLTPGGHYAAVIAKQVQNPAEETTVAPAVSTLIFLRKIGGEQYNLSLKGLAWPDIVTFEFPPTLTALFKNEGNVHLVPTGSMVVKDLFGRLIYKGVLNEGFVKVLPASERYIPIYLHKVHQPFPISFNTMTFEGTDSLGKVTFSRKDVFVSIHPLSIFFPLLAIGLFIVMRKKKGDTH